MSNSKSQAGKAPRLTLMSRPQLDRLDTSDGKKAMSELKDSVDKWYSKIAGDLGTTVEQLVLDARLRGSAFVNVDLKSHCLDARNMAAAIGGPLYEGYNPQHQLPGWLDAAILLTFKNLVCVDLTTLGYTHKTDSARAGELVVYVK